MKRKTKIEGVLRIIDQSPLGHPKTGKLSAKNVIKQIFITSTI